MRKLSTFAAALALLLCTTTALDAQARRGGAGLMLGIAGTYTPSFDFNATTPEFPGEQLNVDLDAGLGVAARAGFAFTPVFVIFGAFEQSWHDLADANDDVRLRHIFGGVRFNMPVAPSLAPYVSGGWGERRIRGEDDEFGDVDIVGNFFDIGGGINVFVAPSLSLDLGINYSFGEFDDFRAVGETINIDTDNVNVWRLRVGLTWVPMTGR